jgi:dTDP-4-dehydrorhamnose 3,5-epimerase
LSAFEFENLSLEGLFTVKRLKRVDARGDFTRLFCDEELSCVGWTSPIRQINITKTSNLGTVRGLHYQNQPFSERKLVTCLSGAIWDVVVDLRRDSKTFLNWHSQVLSEDNRLSLSIPQGFAHGFQTLTADAEVLYFHSAPYNAEAEAGLRFNDPILNVNWPKEITEISTRDLNHPLLNLEFKGVKI